MKKSILFGTLLLGVLLFAGLASAAEPLYVCRPCSREFIPIAENVITDLELAEEVEVTPSSCLGGPCNADYVVKFQGTVYPYMNEDTLRQMLISTYGL